MAKIIENQLLLFDDFEIEVLEPKKHTVFDLPPPPPKEDEFKIIIGDKENIKQHIPKLFIEQAEDVSFAELRFKEAKGYLFTNGTGTGKTLVGLGIAKRFYDEGKVNILIVTPTDKKCLDWQEEGRGIGLDLYKLESVKDAGFEICVTTYSNFYQNNAITEVEWHLVIYDESHYLNQNAKGKETQSYEKHRWVGNIPSMVRAKVRLKMRDKPKFDYLDYPNVDERIVAYEKYKKEFEQWGIEYHNEVERLVNYTKVVFLSATPFAYHKSLKYADGCLFNIEEEIEEPEFKTLGYNEPNKFESFMIDSFGYKMRYGKLTIPDVEVKVDLMEREFFEKHSSKGIMSTRLLDIDKDYSRDFVLVDNSDIGIKIDEGFMIPHKNDFPKEYPTLYKFIEKKFNYIYMTQIMEAIKAMQITERIKQHLDLGRKVIIFHSYNNSHPSHPFQFSVGDFLKSQEDIWNYTRSLQKDIDKFREEFSEYWNLDISDIQNPRQMIRESFPNISVEVNGQVSKGKRSKNIDAFNNPLSGVEIIMIQQSAGKEGISLHDKHGNKPRALLNIGLPVQPVMAIQIEGRPYRQGTKSDSVLEYILLHTDLERIIFAEKIAERSRTVENLALGNKARNLEVSFKEGYSNASYFEPHLGQGVGGKESDRNFQEITEFERAKTYYFSRQKKTSKTKSSEGIDYFATPEPLGYKMVQWLNPEDGEHLLEPSAGHGAIARFFPEYCANHFVEFSFKLYSQLVLNSKGDAHNVDFMNYSIMNKFDKIAMNPPFGKSGTDAISHIRKCIRHMRKNRSKLLAIIPNGPATDKKLKELLNEICEDNVRLTGEILLPQCLFERAGTYVSCKLIRLEAAVFYDLSESQIQKIDLSQKMTINDFFDKIEHLEF